MENNQSNSTANEKDSTSISNVLDILLSAFSIFQKPADTIPPALILLGKGLRPGMSARNLASRIIARYETDAGITMSNAYADGPNIESLKVRIMAEEIISMIQTEAKVDIVIDPGAIQITSSGTAGPIPVATQGSNTLLVSGSGGII